MSELRPGARLDRFELVQRVGEGSQASVWKVVDRLDGRPAALKIVPLGGDNDDELERIRREARALAKLSHPSLVTCRALVEDVQQGYLAAALDWVQGEPLSAVVDSGRLTEPHREHLLRHLVDALAYLHDRDLVHRDLKMANVIVGADFWGAPERAEHVKLADFGIAVPVGNPKPLTQLGAVVGTLRYLPPEVIDDEAAVSMPGRDVFAFGVLAWRLLAKRFPGKAQVLTLDELADFYDEAVSEPARWPGEELEHRWAPALRNCLALDAAGRPATARSVAPLLSGTTKPLTGGEGATQPYRKRGDGETIEMDGETEPAKKLAKTLDATVPAGPSDGSDARRWWLTSPRASYQQLPERQRRSVAIMLVLGIVLIVATVLVLRVLR